MKLSSFCCCCCYGSGVSTGNLTLEDSNGNDTQECSRVLERVRGARLPEIEKSKSLAEF